MRKPLACLMLVAITLAAAGPASQPLTPEEKTFIDQHLSDVVVITPERFTDPVVTKVFSAPLYQISMTMKDADGGTSESKQLAARLDERLVPLSKPSTTMDCPTFLRLANPDFKLAGDGDGKAFQAALDKLFPPFNDSEKKDMSMRRSGKTWTFIRGKFFEKKSGFVVTVDDKNKITAIKFSLELP